MITLLDGQKLMWLKVLLMIIRYCLYGFLSVLATICTWVLSPVLSALSFTTKDGNLPRWCYYFQTHDAPLSEGWEGGYYSLKKEDGSWKLGSEKAAQWLVKMQWLIRNPAYGFAHHLFGYHKSEIKTLVLKESKNWRFIVVENNRSNSWLKLGFSFKGQFVYTKTKYVRVYLGWKISRTQDPDGKVMIVTHINPLRTLKD